MNKNSEFFNNLLKENKQRPQTTEKVMEEIIRLKDKDEAEFKKNQLKILMDSENLRKELTKIFGPLRDTELSPNNEKILLENIISHGKNTNKELKLLLKEIRQKLKAKKTVRSNLERKKYNFGKMHSYKENYKLDITKMWEIVSRKNILEGPVSWQFYKQNVKGHKNSISQTSNY